ncbi:RNA binding repeat protein, Pumilio-family, partial [Cooperia oncophora]
MPRPIRSMIEDVVCSPPGFPPTPTKPDFPPDQRRPFGCLNGNAQLGGNALQPTFTPFRFQQESDAQPSAPSQIVSPLSKLRLNETSEGDSTFGDNRFRSALPSWVMDGHGHIIVPLKKLLEEGLLETFARDKSGCTYLQANYPAEGKPEREMLGKQLFEVADFFQALCMDVFGNFFIQCAVQHANTQEHRWITSNLFGKLYPMCLNRYSCRVIQKVIEALCMDVFGNFFIQCAVQHANTQEHRWITSNLFGKLYPMCLNRYSCRVIQKVIECLPNEMKSLLMLELRNKNLVDLCTDQNANHVIQKIMTTLPLVNWQFIIEHFVRNKNELFCVAENKYGCRVVQLAIEVLSDTSKKPNKRRPPILDDLMVHLLANCERLACNEFANYVIQHVLKAGPLADYRDRIIEECLLRNLLSLSQEKYASHVVEKALEFSSPILLAEMMDEIFDGYVPHPETKKDALDIMLFHQYGNYVVQRMLDLCCEAARAKKNGINLPDMELRMEWLARLETRIAQNRNRLARYFCV